MILSFSRRALALLGFSFALSGSVLAAPMPAYHLAKTYKLDGDGFWDYLTLDEGAHRLYITRDTQVQVLDTRNGKIVGHITGLQEAHGVALVPSLGQGFVTSGGKNEVVCFDLKTLGRVGAPIPVGKGPDAIAYEPTTREIFAMNGDSNSVSVINAATKKVLKVIALGGNPEAATPDGKGNMFINIEGTSKLAQVDAKGLRLLHLWSVSPGEEPTGLAYDAKANQLISGCANQKMMVLDARTGKVVATLPIGKGVDAAAFDPKLERAFTSNGQSGTISIAGRGAKGISKIIGTLPTHIGARTMALDPASHALWTVGANYQPKRAGQRWPEMVHGSAVVLKYELDAPKK